MDERELHELFREASRAAPPASFDEHDVARGARRVTARRRMAAAGGTLAAAAVVAVGGVGIGSGWFDGGREHPPVAVSTTPKTTEPAPETPGPTVMSLPNEHSGCGPPDGGLAQALTAELPEAAGQPPRSAQDCPSGARTASFTVREGTAQGDVTVILSPAGTVSQDQARPGERPDGTQQVTEQTRSGKVLLVRSDPTEQSADAPFEDRLDTIAKGLADQF